MLSMSLKTCLHVVGIVRRFLSNRVAFASNGIVRIVSCSNNGGILYESFLASANNAKVYAYTVIDLLSDFRSGRLCV
jgi:hypothetical protein